MNNEKIKLLRNELNKIDELIILNFAERMKIVSVIGKIKKELKLPIKDMKRWEEVLQNRIELAKKYGLSEKFIRSVWESIHSEALEIEEYI